MGEVRVIRSRSRSRRGVVILLVAMGAVHQVVVNIYVSSTSGALMGRERSSSSVSVSRGSSMNPHKIALSYCTFIYMISKKLEPGPGTHRCLADELLPGYRSHGGGGRYEYELINIQTKKAVVFIYFFGAGGLPDRVT